MKTHTLLLLGLAACGVFAACEEEENPKLNGDYKIYINGVDRTDGNKAVNQKRMTAHEVCRLDTVVMMIRNVEGGGTSETDFSLALGNLDTVNNRLIMEAGNINGIENNILLEEGWCCYLQKNNLYSDTVGYIPQAQRSAIIDTLEVLFADGREKNIDKILDIFQSAFVFYPCTGAEFKEIEAEEWGLK